MSLKNWLKIIIFIVTTILILIGLSYFLSVPEGRDTCGMYGYRFEEKDSIDVLLMGPSTTYTSFYSPLAYEEQGFTSFAISTGNMTGLMYPYVLADALESQSPSLIVVDVAGFAEQEQYDTIAYHRWADTIPNSRPKQEFINTIVEEDDRDSFKYTFLVYHDNWSRPKGCFKAFIDRIDIGNQGYSLTKNFCAYTSIYEEGHEDIAYETSESGYNTAVNFLYYLETHNISNVIFVRYPQYNNLIDGDLYSGIVDAIETAGFDYYDLASDLDIDSSTDFFDTDHVNISGAWKVTKYLSQLIADNYPLKYNYSEKTVSQWNTCASHNSSVYDRVWKQTAERQNDGLYTQRDFIE